MLSWQALSSPARVHSLARPLGGGEAWDLVGDGIGFRQLPDGRFLSGASMRTMALRCVSDDKAAVINQMEAFLET